MEISKNIEIGTHRSHRPPVALDPAHVALDDSGPEDLLARAIELARQLKYVSAADLSSGDWQQALSAAQADWTGFLGEPDGRLAAEFARFFEAPEDYVPANGNPLSQPHVALFTAFIAILRHASTDINTFTSRHLDHHFREVLQLETLPPTPGDVHVTFELKPLESSTYLPQGVRLLGGEEDDAPVYETVEDLEVSHSRIAKLSAQRATFAKTGLRAMLNPNVAEGGMAAIRAYIWANGAGDLLAGSGWSSFEDLYEHLEDRELRRDFPEELQVTREEFRKMMEIAPASEVLTESEEEYFLRWEALLARTVIVDAFPELGTATYTISGGKTLEEKLAAALFNRARLPQYKNLAFKAFDLYQDLQRPASEADGLAARQYVREQLYLSPEDYALLHDLSVGGKGMSRMPLPILEACVQKASMFAPILRRRRLLHLDTYTDAKSLQRGDVQEGWFPYGLQAAAENATFPDLGLVIASPVLAMAEGERSIQVEIEFVPLDMAQLQACFLLTAPDSKDWYSPFGFQVSSEDAWLEVDWRSVAPTFDPVHQRVGFTLTVPASHPAIASPGEKFPDASLAGSASLLRIRPLPLPTGVARETHHLILDALKMTKLDLAVSVQGITKFQAQNHDGEIRINAPFEPFGSLPGPHSAFMIAHPELCLKPLQSIDLQLEWMDVPADVKGYYDPYFVKMGNQPAVTGVAHGLDDFSASLEVVTGRWSSRLGQADVPFLHNSVSLLTPGIEPLDAGYSPEEMEDWEEPTDWPRYFKLVYSTPWAPYQAYAKAERRLTAAISQASNEFAAASITYTTSPNGTTSGKSNATRFAEAQAVVQELSSIVLQPPFVPKLREMRLGYTAKATIDLVEWAPKASPQEVLLHQQPFGFSQVPIGMGSPVPMMPVVVDEGALLIGLEEATPGQPLSFLVKVLSGTGNPEELPPSVHWHYFSQAGWNLLPSGSLLRDETLGFTQTGIIRMILPEDAISTQLEMPQKLHWLVAAVGRDCELLPDWEDIHLHSVQARQVIENGAVPIWNAAAGTVTELEQSQLQAVMDAKQHYPSFGGRAGEAGDQFYRRVSERLRHKGRALTAWDYEHLCLERFPSLYAIKTLQAKAEFGRSPGEMRLVVVPDLRGQRFASPFQPRLGFGDLNEITGYLQKVAPPAAKVRAVNPQYRPVVVGTTLNFKDGISSATGRHLIQRRLKSFLAPWAFDDATAMAFGGRLYVSEVVEVLQSEPYVEFVGKTRLFVGNKEGTYTEATTPGSDTSAYIEVADTDVLTSAPLHFINEIDDEEALNEIWVGISWMVINSDFEVAVDPVKVDQEYEEWLGISWMVVGKDFKVTDTPGN
ncbi:MAG: baseplate J/gp47 family protein [Bacteroidia bacterium]